MLRRLGKYELLERIALGGMAEVYHARQAGPAGFEKDLVVKCILPQFAKDAQFIDMFLDEARIAARLSHPNIVQIIELGEEQGTYFIAMEYIRGISLGDLMDRVALLGVRLPYHYVARIIAHVCAGLDYAHHFTDADGEPLGLVHRDVSPDNVLISYNGAVKMIDFGVAKAGTNRTKTESGVVKGKFAYMSPEQIMGESLDGRSDIFSVGILLYEATVGTPPFGEATGLSTVSSIVNEEPPRPHDGAPDIPLVLEAITLRALTKEREKRYPRARHMQRELEQFVQSHAQYVGDSDVGELIRRVVRGHDEDVRWVGALHAEVSTTPVGPTRRPITGKGTDPEGGPPRALRERKALDLTQPDIRMAGKLGGVGVASGHLPDTLAPAHQPRFRRKTRLHRLARRRRLLTLLGGVLVAAVGAAGLLFWWLGGGASGAGETPRVAARSEAAPSPQAAPAGGGEEAAEGGEVSEAAKGDEAWVLTAPGMRGAPIIEDRPTVRDAGAVGVAAADAAGGTGEDETPDAGAAETDEPEAADGGGAQEEGDADGDADGEDADGDADGEDTDGVDGDEGAEAATADAEGPLPDAAVEDEPRRVTGTIRGQGILVVRSNVEAAEVWIGGQRRGETPFREALVEGTYDVEVRVGELRDEERVRIGYGTEHVVRAHFRVGYLEITGVPVGVVCTLGERAIGRWEMKGVLVSPGRHELVCESAAGDLSRTFPVRVRAGRTAEISWDE